MMNLIRNTRYSYLLAVVGVALMTITTFYGVARAMMIRTTFRGSFSGPRQFGNSFGLTNSLTILAIIIAIVGLAWLGFALRGSHKAAS
jgi:hypothetical protein